MPLSDPHAYQIAFDKLEAAFDLLVRYSPARAKRVRSLSGILIFGKTSHIARYSVRTNICRIWEPYILASETTPEELALTLVHEATHAWLDRLGFGYEEHIRADIEYLCIRAEYGVALRLPSGSVDVENCRNRLNINPDSLTNASFHEDRISALRELGCPMWIIKLAVFIGQMRDRARRTASKEI